MPQDAFTLKFIAKELSALLVGGKISKIAQQSKDLITFIIYTAKGSVKLEICLSAKGCRINLTDAETSAPKTALGFCMLLRKHLQNAQITRVGQIEDERIVFFDFDCTSEFELTKMTLYAELMGKYSNALLVQDGKIVGALKTTALGESAKRALFTGVKYTLPEPQNKICPRDICGITQIFDNFDGDRAKLIAEKIKGVSVATAGDIVLTYGENATAKEVYDYLNGEKICPCVTFFNGQPNDFKARCAECTEKQTYKSVLEAQTAYYAAVTAKNDFDEKVKTLGAAINSAIKKQEKRLASEEEKLADCRDMETVKLKGELITANIYAVKRGSDGFEAVNYYDEKGGKIKIALDKTLSPADNAQRYYKRYAKLKRTAASVTLQKRETEDRLNYLNSISTHLKLAENVDDLEGIEEELKDLGLVRENNTVKKKASETPYRAYICGGMKILAGRNNVQNDKLLKSVTGGDMWLHTHGYHSSHVVICCNGKEVSDNVLLAAAEICAYFSDGRNGNKIPVDYTRRSFVKKPPKSNAGFVIYTDYKTILADPDPHKELTL